jgi:hypothetical protein
LHIQDQQRKKRHWWIKRGERKRKFTTKGTLSLRKRGKSIKKPKTKLKEKPQQRKLPKRKDDQKEATKEVTVAAGAKEVVEKETKEVVDK